jgi:hypothetical protein
MLARVAKVDEPINGPQEMIRRYMVLDRELEKQGSLFDFLRTLHRHLPLASRQVNQRPARLSGKVFQHNQHKAVTRYKRPTIGAVTKFPFTQVAGKG